MVVEGFFIVEYTELLSYNEDDDATLAVDGNNNVCILLAPTVIELDPGVTRREEIKVSVDNRPVVLVSDTRPLTLFILEGNEMTALVEEIVKTTEDESDMEVSMKIRLLFDLIEGLPIVSTILDLTEVVATCKLEDDSSTVWVGRNISVVNKATEVGGEIWLLSTADKVSDIALVDRDLLLGWIRKVDFGNSTETFELKGVAGGITVEL